jgi:hypothetical protein
LTSVGKTIAALAPKLKANEDENEHIRFQTRMGHCRSVKSNPWEMDG